MTKDEQARARLVEIALLAARHWAYNDVDPNERDSIRVRAGFKNPRTGSWCAAGLTAAMEDAGLVVPTPGTPARRGAIALLDFNLNAAQTGRHIRGERLTTELELARAQPGDIIAWLQHPPANLMDWRHSNDGGTLHLFRGRDSTHSACGDVKFLDTHAQAIGRGRKRCSSCVWETRKGHVALIVAVDDERITTVGWNEGNAPGRVMKRRLWRDASKPCEKCRATGRITRAASGFVGDYECEACRGRKVIAYPRSSTVLYRRPGGIYGVTRPVAR